MFRYVLIISLLIFGIGCKKQNTVEALPVPTIDSLVGMYEGIINLKGYRTNTNPMTMQSTFESWDTSYFSTFTVLKADTNIVYVNGALLYIDNGNPRRATDRTSSFKNYIYANFIPADSLYYSKCNACNVSSGALDMTNFRGKKK